MSVDIISNDIKFRACLGCSHIKSLALFLRDGCDNCEKILQLANNIDNVQMYTSRFFFRIMVVSEPSEPCVCRWLKIDSCVPGNYAMYVIGTLPSEKLCQIKTPEIIPEKPDYRPKRQNLSHKFLRRTKQTT